MAKSTKTTKKASAKNPKKVTAAETKTPGLEIGESGTNIFGGIITEEYNSKLSGATAMTVYDEMRKSDATVKAALNAVALPIRRAQWFVKEASEDERDIEIRDFVSAALFDYQSITWDDFLRQALLSTAYGVMPFEKVFAIREIDGVNRIVWQKFAPRLPKSILQWSIKSGDGITQSSLTGSDVEIPIEKLLIFVNEKEGDNWWGISLLRAAYKHWYIKSNLETIDAMAHERQGLGVPYVKLPEGASNDDKTQAAKILKNMRAHDQGHLIEPSDLSVEFKDMHANSTKDAGRAIAYHNRQIVLSVLAQFLDLGSGATGSRALSEDHTNLFLQSIEAIANGIVDVINKFAIRQLVDLNFDNIENYPELDFTGVQRTDVEKLSVAYQRLTQSGGIKPTEQDERYLREVLGLPERTDEEAEETSRAEEKEIEDEADDLNLSEQLHKKKADRADIEEAIGDKLVGLSMAEQMEWVREKVESVGRMKRHRKFFSEVQDVLKIKLYDLERLVFQENNDFKGWRALTFAEKKVNFKALQDFMDDAEANLTEESRAILNKAKDDYTKSLTNALNKNDSAVVKKLELKFKTEYSALLKKVLKNAYSFGKNNAAREMGVQAPPNPNEIMRNIDLAADTIASKHADDLASEAKTVIVEQLNRGENVASTMGFVDAALAKKIEKLTRDTSSIVIAGHINQGRDTVFTVHANKIYALQRSEILDSKTCNFCLSVDGRIIEKTDSLAKFGTFHSNCRGIWVEILKAEDEKPPISGVPKSIRDRIGDATNELVQPKKPIVKKDSLADKAIKKGKAGPS